MPDGPRAGVVVIDRPRVLAGPFCTMMLAELGGSPAADPTDAAGRPGSPPPGEDGAPLSP